MLFGPCCLQVPITNSSHGALWRAASLHFVQRHKKQLVLVYWILPGPWCSVISWNTTLFRNMHYALHLDWDAAAPAVGRSGRSKNKLRDFHGMKTVELSSFMHINDGAEHIPRVEEVWLPIRTVLGLFVRKSKIHLQSVVLKPRVLNLAISFM